MSDEIIRLRMEPGIPEIFRDAPSPVTERTIIGRMARFGVPVERWWGKLEFAEGCFETGRVEPGLVPALWSHDLNEQIGDMAEVMEADGGVDVRLRVLLATQRGRECVALADAGMLSGISPGVRITKYENLSDNGEHRRVLRAEIVEVSLVPVPAEPTARTRMGAERHPLHDMLRKCMLDKDAAMTR